MSRSAAIEQISRQANGSYVGVWGRYLLRCAFQPIFSFGNGRMETVAYEGLIRPFENGMPVSPGAFFQSISAMDRFGVETLTRNLHVLNAYLRIGESASLFINFDPSVFIDRAISDAALRDLRLVLHQSSIDPNRVVCELTEQKSGSEDTLFDFVRALKANGFKIALDDYGADQSDYARVKALQPQIIKFDGAWITRLMESQAGAALLKTMVSTFRDMEIQSLFEGLEETWQLDLAHECGVDMVQGFVLAMPELIANDASNPSPETPNDLAPAQVDAAPVRMDQIAMQQFGARASRPFGRRGAVQ